MNKQPKPRDLTPLDETHMLTIASRAVGKIDTLGPRAFVDISGAEIEAMAVTLVCLGLVPIRDDEPMPDSLYKPLVKHDAESLGELVEACAVVDGDEERPVPKLAKPTQVTP